MLNKHVKEGTDLPKFYMAVGAQDPGAKDGYAIMDYMKSLGIPITENRDKGRHDWDYCNKHIERFMDWITIPDAFQMEVDG